MAQHEKRFLAREDRSCGVDEKIGTNVVILFM